MVTRYGQAAAAAGRPQPLTSRGMSAWPYRVTTHYSFYPVHTFRNKNSCANGALKAEIGWFDDELFTHTCMTSPAKRADVTCQVKAGGRRPEPLFSIPRTANGQKKLEYEYGFIPYILVKKIASKSPAYLSIDTLIWPSLRIVWGFLSGPRVLLEWTVGILRSAP